MKTDHLLIGVVLADGRIILIKTPYMKTWAEVHTYLDNHYPDWIDCRAHTAEEIAQPDYPIQFDEDLR